MNKGSPEGERNLGPSESVVGKCAIFFPGGQVARKFREWTRLTSDPYILAIIKGDKFDFVEKPPTSHFAFNVVEYLIVAP